MHAIKLNIDPARLAQLLQPSLAFCFSLQPMTAHRPVQQLCNSCASLAGPVLCFIACFILLVIAPLVHDTVVPNLSRYRHSVRQVINNLTFTQAERE